MLLVNEPSDIVKLLSINLCPPTANMDALVALGFSREFPAIASGERAHMWVRHIDHGYSDIGTSYKRITKKQRARLSFIAGGHADAAAPANKSAAMRDAHVLQREIVDAALASAAA